MLNKLIVAAAGSGKTHKLIEDSLELKSSNILITTYTEANAEEIRLKFIRRIGFVPVNVTIQTWFSLLIQHGVKPYQSYLFQKKVTGMLLVNQRSGIKFRRKGFMSYWGEADFYQHYFTSQMKIYSDKLAKLVCKLNEASEGKVMDRLANIYPTIFVDESQDLAGYDLELIKLFASNVNRLVLVCDPRQVTYLTHNESKFKRYRNGLLNEFILKECKEIPFEIDDKTLSYSYRCNQQICEYANLLYPEFSACNSKQEESTDHDGVFIVDRKDKIDYLKKYNPVQLRWSASSKDIEEGFETCNMGRAKGLTYNRVLIYPTKKMLDWMSNHEFQLSEETRAKFYVAITRAKFSVAIVCDTTGSYNLKGLKKYINQK